ncbi:phosphatase PAP2 family protein [Pontibacter sp. 172403-2]|uniref:phosphatase PAP2 family protein n=1 Tax=Pontibacter rufus TaxID=2791028 RepID=UPI0018AFEDF1|nr:phosphatase PAP2 family protein [Pontibacter sp. 172403-2]MBF9252244.1 phosphatase PAP2 family protein [Pontibacter sp. 172403-2]
MSTSLFFVVYLLLLTTGTLQEADVHLLKEINLHRATGLDGAFLLITDLAEPIAFAIPLVLAAIGFLRKDAALKRVAFYIGSAILSTGIIVTIVKYSVTRPRPFLTYTGIQNVVAETGYSFPSGHTSFAFALAMAVSLWSRKWYTALLAFAWAFMVAFSRLDLGLHYPTDVASAALIGSLSAFICYLLVYRRQAKV